MPCCIAAYVIDPFTDPNWPEQMTADFQRDTPTPPPRVYRADGETELWIVDPPAQTQPHTACTQAEKVTFTGPRAQIQALRYAYETFGNARFFPY